MKRNDIEEGFTLINSAGSEYVVVNYKNKRRIVRTSCISDAPIDNMMDAELNAINNYIPIETIKDRCGNVVWEKPVELTMQAIADKFGIPVEQLKIKK